MCISGHEMRSAVAERARPPVIEAAVSTVAAPSLGIPSGLFVLADGTRLACARHSMGRGSAGLGETHNARSRPKPACAVCRLCCLEDRKRV